MHRCGFLNPCAEIIFAAALFSLLYAGETKWPPRPSGPVADYAGVFDRETKLHVNALARALWVDEKFGLIVATVRETGNATCGQYAAELYRFWGAGAGVSPEDALVLLRINPPDASVHVGRGARSYLTAAYIKLLLARCCADELRDGDFNRVVMQLTQELARTVRTSRDRGNGSIAVVSNIGEVVRECAGRFSIHPVMCIIIGVLLPLLFVLVLMTGFFRRRYRIDYPGCAFGGGVEGGGFGGAIRR